MIRLCPGTKKTGGNASSLSFDSETTSFLGADFGNFDDAEAVGVSAAKQMAIAPGSMQSSMERIAQKSRNYAKGADEAMEFNEEDRAVANEEAVKDRDGN